MNEQEILCEWERIYGAFRRQCLELAEKAGGKDKLHLREPDGRSVSGEMILEVKN